MKSKVLFQWWSEITLKHPWHGFHFFDKQRYISLIPRQRASSWSGNFSFISAAIFLLFQIFCQNNTIFLNLKPFSSFPTSVCPTKCQKFCHCNVICSKTWIILLGHTIWWKPKGQSFMIAEVKIKIVVKTHVNKTAKSKPNSHELKEKSCFTLKMHYLSQ